MKKFQTTAFIILLSHICFGQNPATGGYLLTKANGSVSIGTEVNTAPLTVANFSTTFPTPQTGTIVHLLSDAVTNGRISFDTYNNASIAGSNYQGRRGRGTAAAPTAAIVDDILVAIGGDGYGDNSFTGVSVGSVNIRANGTFTNTSKPTYISFTTTPTGSITQAERLRILPTGALRMFAYGSGTFTGTPTKSLQVDIDGNIIEGALGGSAAWGSITGTLSDQTDLQTALNGKQASGSYLVTTNNLSDLSNAATARTNIGLGNVTNESKATMFTSPAFTGSPTTSSLAATGAITSSGGGLGYATGAGGTVTQATNKSTGVTLNKLSGQITMNNAALAAGAEVAFTLTNSFIASTDVVIVNVQSVGTAGSYLVTVGAVANGSCSITVSNASGASLSQALVLNFAVIKGVSS